MLPPFAYYALALLLWFSLLALIAWLSLRSGKDGTNKLSGGAGCLISMAFGFMALLGALVILILALFNIPNELVRRGPVRSIEFTLSTDQRPLPVGKVGMGEVDTDSALRPASLRVVLDDDDEWTRISEAISRFLRKQVNGDIRVRREATQGARGCVLVFEFEVQDRDLANFDLALRSIEPSWQLPAKSSISFKRRNE